MTETETGNAQSGACVDVLPRCFATWSTGLLQIKPSVSGDENESEQDMEQDNQVVVPKL